MYYRTVFLAVCAAALSACGGGYSQESCTVTRAAFIAVSDDPADDVALTGPEHAGLTDAELAEVGRIHARQQSLPADAVIVGDFAFCAE